MAFISQSQYYCKSDEFETVHRKRKKFNQHDTLHNNLPQNNMKKHLCHCTVNSLYKKYSLNAAISKHHHQNMLETTHPRTCHITVT